MRDRNRLRTRRLRQTRRLLSKPGDKILRRDAPSQPEASMSLTSPRLVATSQKGEFCREKLAAQAL
jgi:hypothetical protein